MRPTSPPLGPAVLLSYLKRNSPDIDVRAFDLNLLYYDRVLDDLSKGNFKIRLYDWDEKTTAQRIGQAVDFLKHGTKEKFDLKLYHHFVTIFLSFEGIFNAFMSEMAKRHLIGLSVPDRVKIFFEDLVNPVLDYGPDMVGLSVLFNSQTVFALLMASLIKEKKPRYNVALKDGKSYPYIEITNEDFPRIFISRQKNKNGSLFFGPYTSKKIISDVLTMVRGVFPYCSCKRRLKKPCFYYHLNLSNSCKCTSPSFK